MVNSQSFKRFVARLGVFRSMSLLLIPLRDKNKQTNLMENMTPSQEVITADEL